MKTLFTLMLSTLLLSCTGMSEPSKQDLILGNWEGVIDGQSITLNYSPQEITVEEFGMSFPYEWINEDQIKLDALGQEVITRVEFPSPDQMRQTSDQGVQTLTRVN